MEVILVHGLKIMKQQTSPSERIDFLLNIACEKFVFLENPLIVQLYCWRTRIFRRLVEAVNKRARLSTATWCVNNIVSSSQNTKILMNYFLYNVNVFG